MPDEFPKDTPAQMIDIPADLAGLRLDQALVRLLPQYSRSRLQGWIESGDLVVDGRKPRSRDRVVGGERVALLAHYEADNRVLAEDLDLDVIHKDKGIFVVNKPAGMVVHPGAGNPRGTMQNALLSLDPALAKVPRAGIVHRLDKDTSGLLVVARTPAAHAALVSALAEREIERSYRAVCVGVMSGGGTVDAKIGRHRTQRIKMAVRPDGRESITHYRLEERFRAHTLARVELETGRTHQIRVHLAHIGFPIVGDPVYGGRRQRPAGASPELIATLDAFKRQALHAARLALAHPVSGKALEFEAPLPKDMQTLIRGLRKDWDIVQAEPQSAAQQRILKRSRRRG